MRRRLLAEEGRLPGTSAAQPPRTPQFLRQGEKKSGRSDQTERGVHTRRGKGGHQKVVSCGAAEQWGSNGVVKHLGANSLYNNAGKKKSPTSPLS